MIRAMFLAMGLAVASAAPVSAQQNNLSVFLDVVSEGQIRSELFACLRRKLAVQNVNFVEENSSNRTHTLAVRAMTTRTTGGISGYVASVLVTQTMTPELQGRLIAGVAAEDRAKTLTDLAPYGTVLMSRIMVMPRSVPKMCDTIASELETGLFDTSGRAKLPSKT